MLSITRYRNTRYWALWEGNQLLAVTVYKKGALAVMRRLQHARNTHGTAHKLVTLFDLLKDLASTLATLAEEARELRKEHTAMRQQVERIQEAVSTTAGHPPARHAPSPVAALRTRYGALFDAGEFRQAASVYAELLTAEAQGCRCGHVSRHHETEHGGCSICPCPWFVASQLREETP